MITVYGIKNCDTMKKAIKWLNEAGVEYEFHDYKKSGLTAEMAETWLETLGWEAVINRRGTTWRKLDESVRNTMDNKQALSVMLENPSIIKRPLLHKGETYHLGFKADEYAELFNI